MRKFYRQKLHDNIFKVTFYVSKTETATKIVMCYKDLWAVWSETGWVTVSSGAYIPLKRVVTILKGIYG